MKTGESKDCYSQKLIGLYGKNLEDQNAREMQIVDDKSFQREMGTFRELD